MPIFSMSVITLVFLLSTLVLLLLFIKQRQKARKFELTCFHQKFEFYKKKAKDVTSIADGVLLIKKYSNDVSNDFFKDHKIAKFIAETLVVRINSTGSPKSIESIVGNVKDLDDSSLELMLWRKIRPEVLNHLESLNHSGPTSDWLKKLLQ